MAEWMNREDVILALVDGLRSVPELQGVRVSSGWPGDEITNEDIWVGDVEGAIEYPTMQATREQRDDEFDMPLAFQVADRGELDDTRRRLGVLVAAVESWLAGRPLGDVDGLLSAEVTQSGSSVGRTREGAIGRAGLMVHVHARLT